MFLAKCVWLFTCFSSLGNVCLLFCMVVRWVILRGGFFFQDDAAGSDSMSGKRGWRVCRVVVCGEWYVYHSGAFRFSCYWPGRWVKDWWRGKPILEVLLMISMSGKPASGGLYRGGLEWAFFTILLLFGSLYWLGQRVKEALVKWKADSLILEVRTQKFPMVILILYGRGIRARAFGYKGMGWDLLVGL